MAAAEEWAVQQGVTCIRLHSNVIRKEAYAFHRRIGYDLKEQYTFQKDVTPASD